MVGHDIRFYVFFNDSIFFLPKESFSFFPFHITARDTTGTPGKREQDNTNPNVKELHRSSLMYQTESIASSPFRFIDSAVYTRSIFSFERLAAYWAYPHLPGIKISIEYNRRGEKERGKRKTRNGGYTLRNSRPKRWRTAYIFDLTV
jgi:hypothetical protein